MCDAQKESDTFPCKCLVAFAPTNENENVLRTTSVTVTLIKFRLVQEEKQFWQIVDGRKKVVLPWHELIGRLA